MKLSTLEEFSDQFYAYTHIPILVASGTTLIFPKLDFSPDKVNELIYQFPIIEHVINSTESFCSLSDGYFMFAQFRCKLENKDYKIIIGPTVISGTTSPFIANHPFSNFSFELQKESETGFLNHVKFIYFALKHETIENKKLKISYIDVQDNRISTKKRFTNILDNRRSEGFTKDSYQMELRLIHYIRTQKIDKIEWIIRSLSSHSSNLLSSDALQSIRLKFVGFVTIITRTAIQDGIPLETAFSLSDSLIEAMDSMTTTRQIIEYFSYTSIQFMNLYSNHRFKNVSSDTKKVYNYIDMHLTEKISLDEIGKFIGKSPTYISNKFKIEVGETISDYLLTRRIDEAKEMLLFTNFSSQEIAERLNFISQSYFIKCFRKIVGKTPKHYRETNWFYNIWD